MILQSESIELKGVDRGSRLRMVIRGAVQGVGFRPFIYRLATTMGLNGWVTNSTHGVFLEIEGEEDRLRQFQLRLRKELPPRAFIQSLEATFLDRQGYRGFQILPSCEEGEKTALVLPDIATCPECLAEILDPSNRRYRYPFTNCTNCGPRFSIIEALPYDRRSTTMTIFRMCPDCQAEYDDPLNRRFHAQPNACPRCGPHLELWDTSGKVLAEREAALAAAAEAIRRGKIVAVKGLGGFHLMVDSRDERAIGELRRRKHREEKPLALMYPSLEEIKLDCEVPELEGRLMQGAESPIVILSRHRRQFQSPQRPVAAALAPGNPYFGVMLPYTPLHHLLMAELQFPVVATSGNLSDEPICIDEREALTRLAQVADLFLVHDRPIARHVDDSIVRIMANREMVLRRARGYAPLPISVNEPLPPLLATGAHLKNTIAISAGDQVFLSQHIGDLETAEAYQAFEGVIGSFERLYEAQPMLVAYDAHPDYLSTQYASGRSEPRYAVQHHYAHVMACLAENHLSPPVLGVAWDGSGYGQDGTIWGGEFLRIDDDDFERVAHWRTFALPGGESAIREPRRTAIGLLYSVFGESIFNMTELAPVREFTVRETEILYSMLTRRINSPLTSSVGRLFDAVASLVGLRQRVRFEGQAAMELEFAMAGIETNDCYPVQVIMQAEEEGGKGHPNRRTMLVDWEPMIRELIDDLGRGMSPSFLSAKFHNTLVESLVTIAGLSGESRICLSGGCFQNRYLTERAIARLREEGLSVYWHQRIPPNDGGIALGQAFAAARYLKTAGRGNCR